MLLSYFSGNKTSLVFFFTILTLCMSVLFVNRAEAAYPVTELEGYAWSSTIGWISLNCKTGGLDGSDVGTEPDDICGTSNYQVKINGSGTITGWAWSSNIGWIRFGGLSSFPTDPQNTGTNAKATGTYPDLSFEGWARACAGTIVPNTCTNMTNSTVSGGWDGWISLKGRSGGVNWGVGTDSNGMKTDSWAWGGDVVGWVDMDVYADADIAPDVRIDTFGRKPGVPGAGGTEIGGEYMGVGFNAVLTGIPAGQEVAYELSLGANKLTGIYKDGIFTPALVLDNVPYNIQTIKLVVDASDVSLKPGPLVESDPVSGNTKTVDIDLVPTKPVITIVSNPKIVRIGGTVNLVWTITPNTSVTGATCNLQGPGFTGVVTTGGTRGSGPIKNFSTFSVTCTGAFGTVQESTTVEVIPVVQEV